MNVLVTGGAGFIGSNFARLMLEKHPDWKIVVLDALTYAGNLATIADLQSNPQFAFQEGQIQNPALVRDLIQKHGITHIVNFAAESHNDRSLGDTDNFLSSNALGVVKLLEATRDLKLVRMLHVSTDEVYGSIDKGEFSEQSPIEPNTPYSASKAAGDLQCRAHFVSFKTPVVVTRGGNTYGPYQYPEKLIPFFAVRLIQGKKVPLYGDGTQVREWIHVLDHAEGIETALLKGEDGQVYNVGDTNERMNNEIVKILLEETGSGRELVKTIEDPRKGAHDKRYSMTCAKIAQLGWTPKRDFGQHVRETVQWYRNNEDWWRKVTEKPGYNEFIEKFYGKYLGEDL